MERFTWTARVTSRDEDRAAAVVRRHCFEVGPAVRFDEEYPAVTALEHVLAAVGADLTSGLRTIARKRRVQIDNVEAVVTAELNNALTHLGVIGEEGHPGLETVRVKVYVSTLAPVSEVERVWEEVIRRSPLANTFRAEPRLDLELKVIL